MYRRLPLLGSVFQRAIQRARDSKALPALPARQTMVAAQMPVLSTPTQVLVPDTQIQAPSLPPQAAPTQMLFAPPMQAPYVPPAGGGSFIAPAAASDGPMAPAAAAAGGLPSWAIPVGIAAVAAFYLMSHHRGS